MTGIDWTILGILAVSTLISLMRGFVKEALSLLTWVAAILVVRLFATQFALLLAPYIQTDSLRLVAAWAILFIVTLMVGALVNRLVSELVKVTGLSGFDRVLGMVFGFVRGGIIVLILVAALHYLLPVQEDDWYRQSRLIPEVVALIEEFGPAIREQGERLMPETTPQAPEPELQT